jgi:mannose-6-phosphate isomerase-like protein (cupin superfamily)
MNAHILRYQPDADFFIDEQCYINELSNSVSDESLSIAKARVKPGVSTRWHALKNTVERYIILEGKGRVEVGDLPAQELNPHDVVIIPAGCRQRITNTGPNDLIFLALCSPRFDAACYEEL